MQVHLHIQAKLQYERQEWEHPKKYDLNSAGSVKLMGYYSYFKNDLIIHQIHESQRTPNTIG